MGVGKAGKGGGLQKAIVPWRSRCVAFLSACLWLSAGVAVCAGPDAASCVHMWRQVNGGGGRGARFLRLGGGGTDCGIGEDRRALQRRRPCGSERRGPESN